ncbi:MAG: phenylalanine--tRNA ligase subunit alpha [bacterium]|nr:phenylalanine--tRNA ligase subunit alpha [bacterium]
MELDLDLLRLEALKEVSSVESLEELREVEIKYLGRKGLINQLLKELRDIPSDKRPETGKLINQLKVELSNEIEAKRSLLEEREKAKRLEKEKLDVTLPGVSLSIGRLHPLTMIIERVEEIFRSLGFTVVEGFEIESDYYNFEALNIPWYHPARDSQDSFYITDKLLLRTQTSPVQIRVMEKTKPPFKIIAPGRVYRRDQPTARHSPVFHQIEGMAVDKDITFADLKGTLDTFAHALFGEDVSTRFRADYFPFTEPSGEFAISCIFCKGKGCSVCSYSGWIEILGCGMVHPKVLEIGGIDPEEYSGFAFGMGWDRLAMLTYGVNDIRYFLENHPEFLAQF